MKKIQLIVVMLFILSISLFSEKSKIAYANIFKIFDEHPKTKVSTDKLDKKIKSKQNIIKEKEDELTELKKRFDSQYVLWTEERKMSEQKKLNEKFQKYQELVMEIKKELSEQEEKLTTEILKDIESIIKEYGKKHDYTYILRSTGIVYGLPRDDITEDIQKIINEKYKDVIDIKPDKKDSEFKLKLNEKQDKKFNIIDDNFE